MLPDKYGKIVQEIKKLRRPRSEKNVFALGGRGHYENPITDILSFFINPKEEHGFKTLFLKSLFEAVGIASLPILELSAGPNREQYTDQGNRIDLIAESDTWVLVIENKIWHQAVNPFTDYIDFIRSTYKGKTPYFILLSVREETPPPGWGGTTWRTYIDQIKRNAGSYLTSAENIKWHVIMREFILNIESECGDDSMSNDRVEFVKNNYEALQEMNDMLNEYIRHVTNRGMEAVRAASLKKDDVASSKQHNWGEEGIALRLLSTAWGASTNITLLLKRDGSQTIQFYVYDIPDDKVDALRKNIDATKYRKYWTEEKTVRCFGFLEGCEHDTIFNEIVDVARRLNGFYTSVGSDGT